MCVRIIYPCSTAPLPIAVQLYYAACEDEILKMCDIIVDDYEVLPTVLGT